MRSTAYLLVFDGMADWEPALASCEIRKSKRFDVVTAAFSDAPVTTMGGLKVSIGVTLDAINPAEAAVLILPGGDRWEKGPHRDLIGLLGRLHAEGTVIAAICGATLEVARAGLTRGRRHTSNSVGYLKAMIPGYGDTESYIDQLAVADQNLITASGLGSVEFAREVIRSLSIYDDEGLLEWYEMFKHGVIPPRFAL